MSTYSFLDDMASTAEQDFSQPKEFPLMPEGEAVDMGARR